MANLKVRSGSAESFGWLRRPELDPRGQPDVEVWEAPDGKRYVHNIRHGPLMLQRLPGRPPSREGT